MECLGVFILIVIFVFIIFIGTILMHIYTTAPKSNQTTALEKQSYPLALINQDLDVKIQSLWNKHNPEMGMVVATFRKWKISGQNKFLEQVNQQQKLLIEQADMIAAQVVKHAKQEYEFEQWLVNHYHEIAKVKALMQRLYAATQQGLSLEAYDEIQMQAQMSKLRTDEERRQAEIEKDKADWKIIQNIDSALRYEGRENESLNILRAELQEAIIDLYQHEDSTEYNDKTKQRLSDVKLRKVESLEWQIQAREKRTMTDEDIRDKQRENRK